jgi:hypothetical protein
MDIEKEIIKLYFSGIGSTTIAKMIDGVTKKKVLKVLNDNNLINKKNTELYNTFKFDGSNYYTTWLCSICNKETTAFASTKFYLNRNLQKKDICKICSLTKQKGECNPFYGKKHTIETINKISKSKIGVKTSDHMSSKKYRDLIRDLANERWANGSMEHVRIKMSSLMKQRIANGEIRGYIRSKAEDAIINVLNDMDIDVIPNYRVETKIFDIYIPKFNLLVEYNGDYWHCNPNKYDKNYIHTKKNKTALEIWEYDSNKLDLAKINGYHCEVIWESDYKKNKKIINDLITKYYNK